MRGALLVLFALSLAPGSVAARPQTRASVLGALGLRADDALGTADEVAAPWFCHGIDCPAFEPVPTDASYETRIYPPGLRWTSTVVSGVDYDAAVGVGFRRLFRYISGENEASAKIPMTAPVRVRIAAGAGPFCESNITVSFFVPYVPGESDVQVDAPRPTDPAVFEETDEEGFAAFVASFGGYADQSAIARHAESLGRALRKDGTRAKTDHFFFAGYDSPFRVLKRHNEVWYEGAIDEATRSPARR